MFIFYRLPSLSHTLASYISNTLFSFSTKNIINFVGKLKNIIGVIGFSFLLQISTITSKNAFEFRLVPGIKLYFPRSKKQFTETISQTSFFILLNSLC